MHFEAKRIPTIDFPARALGTFDDRKQAELAILQDWGPDSDVTCIDDLIGDDPRYVIEEIDTEGTTHEHL